MKLYASPEEWFITKILLGKKITYFSVKKGYVRYYLAFLARD